MASWTPEEIVQKYLSVEPWAGLVLRGVRNGAGVPVPVPGPGLQLREPVWTGRYEVARREDLADGGLALMVRESGA